MRHPQQWQEVVGRLNIKNVAIAPKNRGLQPLGAMANGKRDPWLLSDLIIYHTYCICQCISIASHETVERQRRHAGSQIIHRKRSYVGLEHPQVAVPHELLELDGVEPLRRQIRGERVPELVEVEPDPGQPPEPPYPGLEAMAREAPVPIHRDKESRGCIPLGAVPLGQIVFEVEIELGVDGQLPPPGRFRRLGPYGERHALEADVRHPEADELALPQSAEEEDRYHRPVPLGLEERI